MLYQLQNLKSTGPDSISAQFPREVAAEVLDPLIMLFNTSLKTGVFPGD